MPAKPTKSALGPACSPVRQNLELEGNERTCDRVCDAGDGDGRVGLPDAALAGLQRRGALDSKEARAAGGLELEGGLRTRRAPKSRRELRTRRANRAA